MLAGMRNGAKNRRAWNSGWKSASRASAATCFCARISDDLGGYDQVGRALRKLVRKGRLLKLGYGIYTRATRSPFIDKPLPTEGAARAARRRWRVLASRPRRPGLEQRYNAGKTTQVPTGRVVGVRGRVRRKIGYDGVPLSYERAGPAPR